jgi:LacI family transcriptional regulator
MGRVTLKDVAREAGVSMQTVSLVIHQREGVSKATRKRVRDVIRRLQYSPAASALALRGAGTRTLGIVYPGTKSGRLSASGYLEEILNGICATANEAKYHILLHALSLDVNADQFLAFEREGRVDGLITVVSELSEPLLAGLEFGGLPVVSIQRPTSKADTVRADNRGGTHFAVSHLVERGHRKLGYLGGNLATYAGQERRIGFLEGCRTQGIPTHNMLEVELPSSDADMKGAIDHAAQVCENWFKQTEPPTGIVCFSDLFAIGAIRAAKTLGLHIPNQVAVVGFNDFPLSSIVEPPLTTAHFPAYEIGQTAAKVLLRRLEQPHSPFEEVVLPVPLVIRDSS